MPTYYVDAATGLDSDTGLTEALAWLTIDKAMNTVAAGDKVWVKGGIDYTELVTIDTLGTNSAGITFEGYTTTPGDGGQFVIDGESTRSMGMSSSVGNGNHFYRFSNMTLENHTGYAFHLDGSDMLYFDNCHFLNNGTGPRGDNDGMFINCTFEGNSSHGTYWDNVKYVNCVSSNNSGDGFYCSYLGQFFNCVSSSNAGRGFYSGNGVISVNNTIDGDSKDTAIGIRSGSALSALIVNTIIYDCETGIENSTANFNCLMLKNNLLNSNTTNYSGVLLDATTTDITAAPEFTDEAGGDYTLATSSAARNAGADASGTSSPGMDIGAHQSQDAGSRVVITG